MKRNPIKLTFNDEPVDTLSVTHIAFWNNGRTTINRDDLTTSDPIRIIAKDGCNILAADVIVTNRPANNFQVTLQRQENTVIIDFDFIDVLYVLVFFPLSIVLAPFIFVYMVVGVLLVLAMMLAFIFGGGRFSLPKELYSIMRYG